MNRKQGKLRVGIVGLGVMSGGYLRLTSGEEPRLELAGIADSNEDALARVAAEYKAPIQTTEYHQLLIGDAVDIIVVATPHYLHHPIVMDALAAGKDVICEKPLAMNAAEAREMIAAARTSGRKLLVGLNMRTGAAFRTIETVMKQGRLGDIFMAKISYHGHEMERMIDPDNWKGSKTLAGGGVLLDGGYHVIDIMNMLLGAPQSVRAICKKSLIQTPNKAEDNAVLLIEYPNDRIGQVTASFTIKNQASKKEPTLGLRLEVYGSEGSAWAEYRSHNGQGWNATIIENDIEKPLIIEPYQPDWISRHLFECILDDTEPIVTAEDALKVHEIVDQAYAQSGILK